MMWAAYCNMQECRGKEMYVRSRAHIFPFLGNIKLFRNSFSWDFSLKYIQLFKGEWNYVLEFCYSMVLTRNCVRNVYSYFNGTKKIMGNECNFIEICYKLFVKYANILLYFKFCLFTEIFTDFKCLITTNCGFTF